MKNTKKSLHRLMLTGVLALPLLASAADEAPGGPQHGPGMAPPPGGECMDGPGLGPGPEGLRHFGRHDEPPFLHGLDLSEAQEDKIFTVMHAQAPYLREQDKAHHKAMRALHELRVSATYDDAAAVKLAQAAAQAMSNIELQYVRTEQKVLAVLTPEQRKQMAERKPRRPRA